MKKYQSFYFTAAILTAFILGDAFQRSGVLKMEKTKYIKTLEPLLLSSEGKMENFHMLPQGTPLYKYYDFPEGHTTYVVYINIKGQFEYQSVESDKANLIDPIWAHPIQPEQVSKLMASTPVSKDDLMDILKARKITRDELAQIVREWKD
ncbi:MAG: hypothetical protein ACEQSK_06010 [Sphingomonadaceae bacterium]